MLSLRRFRALTGSYGADPARWPDGLRAEAEALLRHSAEARAMLGEAQRLDEAIALASVEELEERSSGTEVGALSRIEAGIGARLAAAPASRPRNAPFDWVFLLRWAWMATGGGAAVAAGLLIGAFAVPDTGSDIALSMLQPASIQILAE